MTWRSLIKLLLSCSILLTVSYLVYNSHVPLQGGSENLPRPRAAPEQPHLDPQPCMCQPDSVQLKDKIPKNQFDKVFQRRKDELSKQKKRTSSELSKLLLAPANSPLQYPIQGFTARPLRISPIPGLALYAEQRSSYKVILKVAKGRLSTEASLSKKVTVKGNQGPELTVESSSLPLLNAALASVSYQSTMYHVHTGDLASFSYDNYEATFPIVIKQPQMPVMFDTGTDIKSKVTITIKTFLRYNNLKVLLSSIRRFYPTVPVIVADDSIEPEKIQEENVQQYIMPPAQVTPAARSRPGQFHLLSRPGQFPPAQVTPADRSRPGQFHLLRDMEPPKDKDDDFVFTEDTKIEKFLNVMEAVPELDVVGGSVQGNQFFFSLEYDEGVPDDGGCLYRKSMGSFQTLQGYPQCTLANGVVNFFLARTDSVQKSRFDPLLKRVAHSEWFMDGLGSLMVASCSDVTIGHQPRKKNAEYEKYRRPTDLSDAVFKYQLHFFKNNLKCIKFG
uniref:Uncharacterized protein n=1 Tax=Knipowitschia caucasica TaxID=637954 RepID=A0AAV2KFG1_KNICA